MALSHIVIRSVFCYVYMTFSHFWEKVLLISANIYLFEYSIQHYSYTLLYIGIHFSQFKLNFFSMPSLSDFCMLIPQQASTTQVRTAEEINTKTGGIFMREIRNTKIIAVDHGYGNIKTANTVTPTGITAYETEPIFTGNILEYLYFS